VRALSFGRAARLDRRRPDRLKFR
jgi:hypothetical protein